MEREPYGAGKGVEPTTWSAPHSPSRAVRPAHARSVFVGLVVLLVCVSGGAASAVAEVAEVATTSDAPAGFFVGVLAALDGAPPLLFFGVMALAILLPIPASLFYVAAGSIYGIPASIAWTVPALVINTLLVHVASTGFLRPGLERLVARRGKEVPRLRSKADQNLFITLVRITPGIPYFLQNLVLALAGVDRVPFVLISVAVQMIYATGFIVLGRSAFEGELGLGAVAVGLLAAVAIVARLVHARLRPAVPPAGGLDTIGGDERTGA